MITWLLYSSPRAVELAGSGSLSRITVRASLAAVCSFVLAVLLGPRLIRWLNARYREPIVSDSEQIAALHRHKQWTPTMGGLFIMAAVLVATALLADLSNPYVLASVVLLLGYAAIGVYDDQLKLTTGRGVSAKAKLAAQAVVALVVALLVYGVHRHLASGLELALPLTDRSVPLGMWFIPLAVVVIVGSSNAVNLTDGLDGLACGCLVFSLAAMCGMVYVAGHAELADYLRVPRISGAGELTIVATATIGAVLGFLWFNCHPAQVFMGDTGSLPLGGLLGFLAVVARQELLLVVIAGVFVAEAASVLLQVGYFRWRQRRIFRCAPLHHHFQLKGWSENKIVVRFWIASALCAILGLAGLKGRIESPPPLENVVARAADADQSLAADAERPAPDVRN